VKAPLIDTVTFVVPAGAASLSTLPGWEKRTRTSRSSTGYDEVGQEVAYLENGLSVRTQACREGGVRLVVSGSIPQVAQGHNATGVPLSIVRDVVASSVQELVDVAEDLRSGEASFSRLDTVTDFEVNEADVGAVLRGYEAVPIRKGVRRQLIRSSLERPETLWAQNGAGGFRLYDNTLEKTRKGVAVEVLRSVGQSLRFEAQARRDWVKAAGARMVSRVDDGAIAELHARRVVWGGLDREVVTMGTWVDELAAYCTSSGVSDAVRYGATGYALDLAAGRTPTISKNSATKYRRVLQAAGVSLSMDELARQHERRYRLDFDRAEVVRLAA
jgi:hypothetical protein